MLKQPCVLVTQGCCLLIAVFDKLGVGGVGGGARKSGLMPETALASCHLLCYTGAIAHYLLYKPIATTPNLSQKIL